MAYCPIIGPFVFGWLLVFGTPEVQSFFFKLKIMVLVSVRNMSIIKTLGIGLESYPKSRHVLEIGLERDSKSKQGLVMVSNKF